MFLNIFALDSNNIQNAFFLRVLTKRVAGAFFEVFHKNLCMISLFAVMFAKLKRLQKGIENLGVLFIGALQRANFSFIIIII